MWLFFVVAALVAVVAVADMVVAAPLAVMAVVVLRRSMGTGAVCLGLSFIHAPGDGTCCGVRSCRPFY